MKQVLRFILLVLLTPFLLALPFAVTEHRIKAQAKSQVWENAESILMACDMLRSTSTANANVRSISVDPKGPEVSLPLRNLDPIAIEVRNGRVQVGLAGGFSSYGLMAYAEGVTPSGTVQVIPRLWWYED